MISILDKVFNEYTETDVASNRLSPEKAPQMMLSKAFKMDSGRKRDAIVKGAKHLLNRKPS